MIGLRLFNRRFVEHGLCEGGRSRKRARQGAAGLIIAAFLTSGCVSVLPDAPPPSPRYSIAYVNPDPGLGAKPDFSLSVDDALASRAIDTTKIAFLNTEGQYKYYSNAEWTDRAPRLFMAALVRSFQNVDGLINVGTRATQPIADYVLQTDLRAFEARENGGPPTVRVEVFARVTDVRGRAYGSQLFTENLTSTITASGEAGAAARALNEASGRVVNDIVLWSLGLIDEIEAAKAKS